MTATRSINFTNGNHWAVGVGLELGGDQDVHVMVPAKAIDNLTNEEIGAMVRQCVPFALRLDAEVTIDYWYGNYREFFTAEKLNQLIAELEPYEAESTIVAKGLSEIRDTLVELREKEARRALKRTHSKSLRNRIIERDRGICRYCGNPTTDKAHLDHVVPYSLGGKTNDDNLVVSCPKCNLKKGGRTLEQAGMVLLPISIGAS